MSLLPPNGARPTPIIRNAADVAAELIRAAILEGRFRPGDHLREERLAADLGISRTPIREALLILHTEGIVHSAPNRGSIVRRYDSEEIADLYETRALLEAHAASKAARLIRDDELALLSASCGRYEALVAEGRPLELAGENRVYHEIILNASRSASLAHFVGMSTRLPLIYRSFYWYSQQEKELGLHFHRRILRALEERDGDRAANLMREHILEALDVLRARLD